MAGVEIVRFRVWLEVGGTPDGPLDGSEGDIFPITSVSINASLNSIPSASVTVALGKRVQDGKPSPIHGEAGAHVRNPMGWPWGRIYYRNLHTGEVTVIFEGFVEGAAQFYSFENTEINLMLRHWAYALDAHPCISALSNPDSSQLYTQMLYFRSLDATVGTGGIGDTYHGVLFSTVVGNAFDESQSAVFREDIVENGVMKMLGFLDELAEDYVPWDLPNPERIKPDLPLSVSDVLEKRMKTGDTEDANPKQDEFPILKLQSGAWYEDMSDKLYTAMADVPAQQLMSNSLWASLMSLAGLFELCVVPRVHELRFIPKWYVPPVEEPKVLKGVASISPEWTFNRPVGAVIMIPKSLDGNDIVPVDFPASFESPPPPPSTSIDQLAAEGAYGIYIPEEGVPGTLLVRQRADWLGEIADTTLGIYENFASEEATEDTTTSADGTPVDVKEKEVSEKGLYNGLAEEAYWDEMLRGKQAKVLSPIRFDVCPGSTVKIRTGGDIRLMAKNSDQLSSEFLGFVTSIQISIDTINATANSQYTLSHVRDAEAPGQVLEDHPIYRCGPFSNATWTRERFKTVEGTE